MSDTPQLPLETKGNGHAEEKNAGPGSFHGAAKIEKPEIVDFNWADDADVVVPTQPAIAVYFNRCDEVVIRQEAAYPDEDQFIRIRRENLWPLIRRLQELDEGQT